MDGHPLTDLTYVKSEEETTGYSSASENYRYGEFVDLSRVRPEFVNALEQRITELEGNWKMHNKIKFTKQI